MLSLLWEAIIGLIVGALAKWVMPGKNPGGVWITMALGIAGSIVATWLGKLVGWCREGQTAGLIMSIAGAVLLLFLVMARQTVAYEIDFTNYEPEGREFDSLRSLTMTWADAPPSVSNSNSTSLRMEPIKI